MKRNLLLVLFFSGSFYAGAQNPPMHREQFEEHFATTHDKQFHTKAITSVVQLIDSIYYWAWDTLTNTWKTTPDFRTTNIVYDANNNRLSDDGQYWNGSNWINWERWTLTYDGNNNNTSMMYQMWNGSVWDNSDLYINTYDANNNLTAELYQFWNASAWEDDMRFIYTYDANNNRLSWLIQNWNGSVWVDGEFYTYTYDVNNNKTGSLYQTWNGSAWVNSQLHTYTYDANNNMTSDLHQSWIGSVWVNNNLYTYTYDANNNMINELLQQWNANAWVNSYLGNFSYDANDSITVILHQNWSGSAWINFEQYSYTYDANNFRNSFAYIYWDNIGSHVALGDSTHYYYHTVIGINELMANDDNSFAIFPNPTSGSFTIESINQDFNNSTISISNMLGEEIYSSLITHHSSLITLNAPNGIYFVQLRSNEKTFTRKIIINK